MKKERRKVSDLKKLYTDKDGDRINLDRCANFDIELRFIDVDDRKKFLAEKLEYLFNELPIPGKNYLTKKKKVALENILSNIIQGNEKEQVIKFYRGTEAYNIPKMYGQQHYKFDIMVPIVDALFDNEYIDGVIWKYDAAKPLTSRIWALNKLCSLLLLSKGPSVRIARFNRNGLDIETIEVSKKKLKREAGLLENKALVQLRAKKKRTKKGKEKRGKLISYPPDKNTIAMEEFLKRYNGFIVKHKITFTSIKDIVRIIPLDLRDDFMKEIKIESGNILKIKHLFTSATEPDVAEFRFGYTSVKVKEIPARFIHTVEYDGDLRRVFSHASFELGGRFYGADYQRKKEVIRENLLIDGEPVVELDYSALGITMLYHMEGIEVDQNDYLYSGVLNNRYEKFVKKMTMIMINTRSRRQAIEAFKKFLHEKERKKNYKEIISNFRKESITPGQLVTKIERRHPRVNHLFFKEKGLELQNKDATIASEILQHFLDRKIVCLCIHDSFIVPQRYENELEAVMLDNYKKHLDHLIKIK